MSAICQVIFKALDIRGVILESFCVCMCKNQLPQKIFLMESYHDILILLKHIAFAGYIQCVQSLSYVGLFATLWTAACQASLFFTMSQSLFRFMSIESELLSSHLLFCCPLLLLSSIFPRVRVFPNESTLHRVAKVLEQQK